MSRRKVGAVVAAVFLALGSSATAHASSPAIMGGPHDDRDIVMERGMVCWGYELGMQPDEIARTLHEGFPRYPLWQISAWVAEDLPYCGPWSFPAGPGHRPQPASPGR